MSARWSVATALAALLMGVFLGSTLTSGSAGEADRLDSSERPSDSITSAVVDPAQEPRSERDEVREAAVTYASASQEWLYLTDPQIEEAIRAVTVSDRADQLVEETVSELSVARDGLQFSAGRIWWFVRPLATKVGSVSGDRARVSVWVVTVLSAADVAVPQSDWVTLDIALRRVGDRWLLESIDDTVGPTPLSGVRDEPWQPEPFDDALAGFERIGSETS